MSWMKHTGCRYHTQDTDYYCGAASAMMILAELGIPYANLDQDDLYTSNHNHNMKSGWATDPVGLCFTLNDRRPTGYYFVVHRASSEANGTRDIVFTLHHYGVSPAVLVFGCQHWIVVPGVQTDVEPVTGAAYTVDGFWIQNPIWHNTPPPPPHSATDQCGNGGTNGVANDFITYTDWQLTYLTGCNYDDPGGNAQYISVCDPDPRDLALPLRRVRRFLFEGRRLIKSDEVAQLGQRGLEEYNLHKDKRVAEILGGAKPGKPHLVTRLDKPNSYYYLIPLERDRKVVGFARVHARFGEFQSLHLLEKPTEWEFLNREAVIKKTGYQAYELADMAGRLVIHPETVCILPTLVWQPCRESFSPHLPFYQLTIGGHTLYVRVDGEVFTSLTTGKGV